MQDPEKFATAIRSDAVDAEFWGIVLQDEDLLGAEFDSITEPAETRIPPPQQPLVGADQSSFGGQGPSAPQAGGIGRLANAAGAPGQGWRRQRSPPGQKGPSAIWRHLIDQGG